MEEGWFREGAAGEGTDCFPGEASPEMIRRISDILRDSLGIVRDGEKLKEAGFALEGLLADCKIERERNRVYLAQAMVMSAEFRRESRGAHYRSDYPVTDPAMGRQTRADLDAGCVTVSLRESLGGDGYADSI